MGSFRERSRDTDIVEDIEVEGEGITATGVGLVVLDLKFKAPSERLAFEKGDND